MRPVALTGASRIDAEFHTRQKFFQQALAGWGRHQIQRTLPVQANRGLFQPAFRRFLITQCLGSPGVRESPGPAALIVCQCPTPSIWLASDFPAMLALRQPTGRKRA